MWTLDVLMPQKLEEQGNKEVSEAQRLLDRRGAELSQPRHDLAQDLLDCATDFKENLGEKPLLKRIKQARLYAKKAREALDAINDLLGRGRSAGAIDFGPLDRPIRS